MYAPESSPQPTAKPMADLAPTQPIDVSEILTSTELQSEQPLEAAGP
jgi:hypothetical protein